MSEALGLYEMLDNAKGEVAALESFIELHRRKKTRPDSWFASEERRLKHRRQVVILIEREIARRAEKEKAA